MSHYTRQTCEATHTRGTCFQGSHWFATGNDEQLPFEIVGPNEIRCPVCVARVSLGDIDPHMMWHLMLETQLDGLTREVAYASAWFRPLA